MASIAGTHRGESRTRWRIGRELVVGVLLALTVLAVYAPVRDHDFVEFDDPLYVSENPMVRQGVTGPGGRFGFHGDG